MKRYFAIIGSLVFSYFSLTQCGEAKNPLYRLEVARVPVMQFLKVTDGSEASCATYPYCQQFPARPSSRLTVKFVLISPESVTSTIEITKISHMSSFSALAGSARSAFGEKSSDACAVELSSLGISKNTALSKVTQTTPMRVEEVAYNLNVPSWSALITKFLQGNCFPAYKIEYTATSSTGDEKGIGTVFLLPDPSDAASWTTLKTSLAAAGVDEEKTNLLVSSIKRLATTNTPPKIENFSPPSGDIQASSDNEISVQLNASADGDKDARARLQWFVSKGKLNTMNAKTVKWNPDATGSVGAFVIVRDIQGGVDYRFVNLTAR